MLFSCKLDPPNPSIRRCFRSRSSSDTLRCKRSRRFINSKNFGAEPVIISTKPLSDSDGQRDQLTMERRRDAISVRNAYKRYGSLEKGTQVLTNLTLTVKEGTIYTLLGSSGCGKTTLLSSIVGMTELDEGDCEVFGRTPGTRGSGIPGKLVGYMPQDIALYGEFTIKEAMQYFGKIYGMSNGQITDRMTFLIKFLHLPPSHRRIGSLSGGQQRRVSFAVALLHEPKILILDEPTVGVDPLLRKSIWKHLTGLVESGRTTVVITTHYIEEATEAHCIGLLRNGRLLAEDSPPALLAEFECDKLEEVFFKLSLRDTTNDEFNSVRSSDTSLRSSKVSSIDDAENVSSSEDATTTSSLQTEASGEINTVAVFNEKNKDKRNNSAPASIETPKSQRDTIGQTSTIQSTVSAESSGASSPTPCSISPQKNEDCETVPSSPIITHNEKEDDDINKSPVSLANSDDAVTVRQGPIVNEEDDDIAESIQSDGALAFTPKTYGARSNASSPTSPAFNTSVEKLFTAGDAKKEKNLKNIKNEIALPSANRTIAIWRSSVKNSKNNDISCTDDCFGGFSFDFEGARNRMSALLHKNFLCMLRNLGFLVFIFLLPAFQAVLFCVAIGGHPVQLPMGIINHENLNTECYVRPGCSPSNMSCSFLKQIPNDTINLVRFVDENDALEEVKLGNLWGYMVIPSNFSQAMIQKGTSGDKQNNTSNQDATFYEDGFQRAHISLYLDLTSQQITFTIQKTLSEAFQKFTTSLIFSCGMDATMESPSDTFATPIYGRSDYSFREFMAPGIMISIIFFMSVALTGSAFVSERREGMLDRSLVAGVSTGEIITAHMITQYVVMVGQTLLVLAVMGWVFHLEIEGSVITAIFLTLCQGTCGMAYGFLISCICSNERNAIQMALGSFYPNLLLSGVVWPLESIPFPLRQIAVFLPQTQACEAMRSIFSRGWGINHTKVWTGFASSLGWSMVFWTAALLLARMRKK